MIIVSTISIDTMSSKPKAKTPIETLPVETKPNTKPTTVGADVHFSAYWRGQAILRYVRSLASTQPNSSRIKEEARKLQNIAIQGLIIDAAKTQPSILNGLTPGTEEYESVIGASACYMQQDKTGLAVIQKRMDSIAEMARIYENDMIEEIDDTDKEEEESSKETVDNNDINSDDDE